MANRISRRLLLDAATAGLVGIALLTLMQDRLLPALAERARLDPGERASPELQFRGLASGDTVALTENDPSLVVVFKSTCPVCEETAPDWAALARLGADRVFAVGLEADTSAAAWTERMLSGVQAVVPTDPGGFVDRLRIRAVPTTLLFEGRRLELARIGPLQPEDRARIRRAFQGRRAPGLDRTR